MGKNSLLNDPMVLRELIMDHYKYPHNHGLKKCDAYCSCHLAADSCIDDITVETKIEDGKIQDVRFDGEACTISTASTSMLSDLLMGKTVEQAKIIMQNYYDMLDGKEYDEDILEEAVAMKNVYKQANRINCALIGWRALNQLIEESEAKEDGKHE